MRFTKRGIAAEFLVWTIIILISGAILFLSIPNIQKLFTTTSDTESCHDSVLLRAAAIEKTGLIGEKLVAAQVPLKCKTSEIEISSTDKEKIKNEVANEMYSCWWQLGEGQKNFIEQQQSTQVNCLICSVIKFSDSVKENVKVIDNFQKYLQENFVPGKNISYAEYLFGKDKSLNLPSTSLDLTKDYMITFYSAKNGFWKENWDKYFSLSIGAGVAIAGVVALVTTPITGGVSLAVFGLFLAEVGVGGAGVAYGMGMVQTTPMGDTGIQILPYSPQYLQNLKCTTIQSVP